MYSNRTTIILYNILFTNDVAHSQVFELVSYIRKLPIYKQKIKMVCNSLDKKIKEYALKAKIQAEEQNGAIADACDVFSENLKKDILKLEYAVKNVLDKNCIADSDLLAKTETARVLTDIACLSLDMRIKDGINECPQLIQMTRFRMTGIFYDLDKLASLVYKDKTKHINLNDDTNCTLAVKIIQKKLSSGTLIANSVNESTKLTHFAS